MTGSFGSICLNEVEHLFQASTVVGYAPSHTVVCGLCQEPDYVVSQCAIAYLQPPRSPASQAHPTARVLSARMSANPRQEFACRGIWEGARFLGSADSYMYVQPATSLTWPGTARSCLPIQKGESRVGVRQSLSKPRDLLVARELTCISVCRLS